MPSTEEERNERAQAVSNAAPLLVMLLDQLHLRVGLRKNLNLLPPADTMLERLKHATDQLNQFSKHSPHSREATRILAEGFQVVLDTLEWLDQAPLADDNPASHRIAEQPAEPAGILMNESGPNLEWDQREVFRREVLRIQQNLAASAPSEASHIEPAEYIERSPIKEQEKQPRPPSQDPETLR